MGTGEGTWVGARVGAWAGHRGSAVHSSLCLMADGQGLPPRRGGTVCRYLDLNARLVASKQVAVQAPQFDQFPTSQSDGPAL